MTIDLDALQALCDAATPGPWEAHTSSRACEYLPKVMSHDGCEEIAYFPETSDFRRGENHNCALVAAARTAMPALIEEVRALRAKVRDFELKKREQAYDFSFWNLAMSTNHQPQRDAFRKLMLDDGWTEEEFEQWAGKRKWTR